jgi:hypothetical protein
LVETRRAADKYSDSLIPNRNVNADISLNIEKSNSIIDNLLEIAGFEPQSLVED